MGCHYQLHCQLDTGMFLGLAHQIIFRGSFKIHSPHHIVKVEETRYGEFLVYDSDFTTKAEAANYDM